MFGAKITDLFLAEKNLVDFVEKNLGQEWERLKSDELEMDSVCHHLIGGTLDYPVMISHDFCDITTAWDIYIHAFTRDVRAMVPKKFGYGVNEKPIVKNPLWGKMPFRGDELTPKQFVNAICHCGPKIRNHIIDCTLECTQSGRLENLYPIISNIVVIRNYIWIFQEVFDADSKNKLKPEYKQFCDLVEVISEQMLQVQANLLLTFILHDEDSQSSQSHHSYYEGERGSPTIQMWSYFVKSMQRDMWKIMPPQLAQKILGIIISDSLAILVSRYSKMNPSEVDTPQFVCDIANILATVEELLFFICTDLTLVCGEADQSVSKSVHSIHLKCSCLATSLILVGCPLEILYKTMKTIRRGTLMEKKLTDVSKPSEPIWMEIIKQLCPKFYPSNLSSADWELLFSLKLLSCQPQPNWALIYRVVTMQDCKMAKLLLLFFPTLLAPVSDFMLEGKAFQKCGHASCISADCHSLAKSLPNHYVAASTLYIVAHGQRRDMLVKVFRPILSKIVDWSVMDKTQMWNSKSKPVWFQSIIDILLPILKTCIQSLCLTIFALEKEQLQHSEDTFTQLVIELLNALTEILSVLPRGFFLVCEEMDDMIPVHYVPVRNNVPVHFLVTALYILLNLGPKIAYIPLESPSEQETSQPQQQQQKKHEQVSGTSTMGKSHNQSISQSKESKAFLESTLVSVAERLCSLDDPVFDQGIHRLVTQIESMMKQMQTQSKNKENVPNDPFDYLEDYSMTWDLANLKADFLLEEVEGQLALRIIYWFIMTHGDMLQNIIAGNVNSFITPHVQMNTTTTTSMANNSSNNIGSNNQSTLPTTTTPTSSSNTSSTSSSSTTNPSTSNRIDNKATTPATSNVQNSSRNFQQSTSFSSSMLNLNLLKIAPRIRTYIKPQNVIHEFHFVNKYRLFDEILWNENFDWVKTVRYCKLGLHKSIISKQLERRWEFNQNNVNSTSNKMVDEIKALIT